jgi:hypothetical protein
MPLRVLLDRAVIVSRRNFATIFPTVAIPLAIVNGLYPLGQAMLMRWAAEAGGRGAAERYIPMVAGIAAGVVVLSVAWLFGNGALSIAAMDAVAGRPVSMPRAWRMVASPRVWGTLLLSTLAFVAGFACCLLPGIYAGLIFSLTIPVMVEEGKRGTAALARSAALAQYNPQKDVSSDPRGKAFLIAFVGTLMGYALAVVLQMPFLVAQQIYIMRMAAGGRAVDPAALAMVGAWFQVPSSMLGSLGQTAVHLYIAVGLALLYLDVRGRKEGGDLEAAVARLEGGVPAPAETP